MSRDTAPRKATVSACTPTADGGFLVVARLEKPPRDTISLKSDFPLSGRLNVAGAGANWRLAA
jgi:hypothetical protein